MIAADIWIRSTASAAILADRAIEGNHAGVQIAQMCPIHAKHGWELWVARTNSLCAWWIGGHADKSRRAGIGATHRFDLSLERILC
jgi:hypothetical protein